MVAPRALAWNREARHPAARSRLQVIAAQVSHAAFAVNDPMLTELEESFQQFTRIIRFSC